MWLVGHHHMMWWVNTPAHVSGWTPPADGVPVNFLPILARNRSGMVENQHNLAQSHQNFDPSPTVTTGRPPDPTFGPFRAISRPLGGQTNFPSSESIKNHSWRSEPGTSRTARSQILSISLHFLIDFQGGHEPNRNRQNRTGTNRTGTNRHEPPNRRESNRHEPPNRYEPPSRQIFKKK